MLFLILLSLVLISSAEGQHFRQNFGLKINRGSDKHNECEDLVFGVAWESLGIRETADGDQSYKIDPETKYLVANLLSRYEYLTARQKIDLAKEEHPELTRDIENYVAALTRPVLLYVISASIELENKKRCITNEECKVMLSKNDAILLLNVYAEKLVNFGLNLGELTNESFAEKLHHLDKMLNLKCNWKCLVTEYNQWMTTCVKPNNPFTTGATDAYPVETDSYVSSN